MTRLARIASLLVLAAVALAAVGLSVWLAPPVTGVPTTLQATIGDVARDWPRIGHVTPTEVERRMAEGRVVVFDVRTPQEHAVSRLPGAIHVDPDMTVAEFLARHGDAVKGKTAVFYCAVGVRSSRLATRVAPELEARGAIAVDDMAGGIFAWHGDARPLLDAKGPTNFVHPYDAVWGRLLARPELAREEPRG
jgi:rhodanese-related sulfurtransferase